MSTKKNGFTLIELLVAMVVSGITLTSVMGSFWLFIQTHERAELNRDIQRETRFAMTRIADKARSYSIDYAQYEGAGRCAGAVNRNHKLCLEESHDIEFKNNNLFLDEQPLFSKKRFFAKDVFFGLSPNKDPRKNLGDLSLQIQPKITIFLEIESKKDSQINLKIQTTLSSRKY